MMITIDKFQDFLLYSNKNIEKLISKVVNESSNASLVSLYEDAVILLDHTTGNFYNAKYNFNAKEGTIMFEDFDEIQLTRDSAAFKNAVQSFFEEEIETSDLKEAYSTFASNQEAFLDKVVSESMAEKDFNNLIDYSPLQGINEEVSIKEKSFYKEYVKRIETHPMPSIKTFNWVSPVKISLIENENIKIVNKNAKSKANSLYKDSTFKARANEAFSALKEGNEETLISFVEDYSQVFYLDKADRKTVFSKATMGNADLLENRLSLFKQAETLFEENEDIATIMSNYREAEEAEAEAEDEETETPSKDAPKELTPEETDELITALETALEKVEDEKLANKIEALIKTLSDGKETGTDVETVKESISLLSL